MTTVVVEESSTTVVVEDDTNAAVVSVLDREVIEAGVAGPQGPPGPEGPPGSGGSVHDFLGASHELEGLTAGHVLRATDTDAAEFQDIGDTYALIHAHPYEPTGTAAAAITTHLGATEHHARQHALNSASDHTGTIDAAQHPSIASGNLHPEYLTQAEADALYDPTGTAAAAVATHAGLADAHPGYLTPTEGDAAYARLNAANTFTTGTQAIVGDADEVQFSVRPFTGQASNLAEFLHDDGEDAFTVLTSAGSTFLNLFGTATFVAMNSYGDANFGSRWYGRKARGTRAAPTNVGSGDVLLYLLAEGWSTVAAPSGTPDFVQGGFIGFEAEGAPGAFVPVRLRFALSSSTATFEAMRITSTGDLYRLGAATTVYAMRNRAAFGDANDLFHIRQDGLMEWGAGGGSAVDVALYRSAADILQTDDQIRVNRGAFSNLAFSAQFTGATTVAPFAINAAGTHTWGDGTNTRDVTLQRHAANVLKTDDQFVAADGVQTKFLSGSGKVTAADGDFTATPADGMVAVVRNTTDGKVRLAARANGAWVTAELS